MKIEAFTTALDGVLELEFKDRNVQIQIELTKIKEQMASRGIVNSTITLNNYADFYFDEFRERIDYLGQMLLGGISKLSPIDSEDLIEQILTYYDTHAGSSIDFCMHSYLEYSKATRDALSNGGMARQIESMISSRIANHAEKTKRIVSLEYKAALKQGAIISGAPTIYGVRFDVVQLVMKVFGNKT